MHGHFVYLGLKNNNILLMKIQLIVIGKTDESYLQNGINLYLQRLKHYIPFEITVISGLKNAKSLTPEQIMCKEAALLLKQIQNHDFVILLDERGRKFNSLEFSDFIEKKIQQNVKSLAFIVGGAYGFSKEIAEKANMKLSFSDMTFSHQMIRLFFVEQLYRAFTILRNEPYHNE
jgi:23S rRNA (pseudouridine1915-N3)-methyltransferase